MVRPHEFSPATKQMALERQKHRCGSCGTKIVALGEAGRFRHEFDEGSQAHHIKHVKFGGTESLHNCAILCDSCHCSVHECGNYRFGKVVGSSTDFPHYNG